ncbi:hypothetical protein HN011_000723 [Eciton burchellii]|nr:hypothetical protein HN011_000723 [Eciton burchellii]
MDHRPCARSFHWCRKNRVIARTVLRQRSGSSENLNALLRLTSSFHQFNRCTFLGSAITHSNAIKAQDSHTFDTVRCATRAENFTKTRLSSWPRTLKTTEILKVNRRSSDPRLKSRSSLGDRIRQQAGFPIIQYFSKCDCIVNNKGRSREVACNAPKLDISVSSTVDFKLSRLSKI